MNTRIHSALPTWQPPSAFRHIRRHVADQTGPLEILQDRLILAIADVQNLDLGARDLGFELLWGNLETKLRSCCADASLHAVFSRQPGNETRLKFFAERGWTPHAKTTRLVRKLGSWQRQANADNFLSFVAGTLCMRTDADVVIIGTGDGELAHDVAEGVQALVGSIPVVTLSLAGSTATSLDARFSELFTDNIEIGRDCLRLRQP